MLTIADLIINFYASLEKPRNLPNGISVLYPFREKRVIETIRAFYQKYFSDTQKRVLLIGINPGRFGGGVTGIPFTDPLKLEKKLELKNKFESRPELSSEFMYNMIDAFNGPVEFYKRFLMTSVSPLGFVKDGRNMNYYDNSDLQRCLENYMVKNLKWHVQHVGANKVAYSLGQGKNFKYLEYLNNQYALFDQIEALPHPRWVMQYRRKRMGEFIEMYLSKLGN